MIKIVNFKLCIFYHNKNLEKKMTTISKGDALTPVYSQ